MNLVLFKLRLWELVEQSLQHLRSQSRKCYECYVSPAVLWFVLLNEHIVNILFDRVHAQHYLSLPSTKLLCLCSTDPTTLLSLKSGIIFRHLLIYCHLPQSRTGSGPSWLLIFTLLLFCGYKKLFIFRFLVTNNIYLLFNLRKSWCFSCTIFG